MTILIGVMNPFQLTLLMANNYFLVLLSPFWMGAIATFRLALNMHYGAVL